MLVNLKDCVMHYFFVLFPFSVWVCVVPISGKEPQQNLIALAQIHEQKLAANDATGELREFVKKITNQTETMARGIEECDLDDQPLAQIYSHLRVSLVCIYTGSVDEAELLEALREGVVEAVFLSAERMEIPSEQIAEANKAKKGDGIELLKELAKNWDKNNWGGKGTNDKNDKGKEGDEHSERSRRQRQRETLKLILAAVQDANIGTISTMSRSDAGDGPSRRRRKKRDSKLVWVIVVLGIVMLAILSCCLSRICQKSSQSAGASKSAASASGSSSVKLPKFEFNQNAGVWSMDYFFPKVTDG